MAPENRGIVKISKGEAALRPIAIPKCSDDALLVRTVAVALNPTDWQTVDETPKKGNKPSVLGCDAAGIVVAVGKKVTKIFKKGDRVAGAAHGGNDDHPEYGTHAEYILLKGDIAMHVPKNLSLEAASTLPCGLLTTGLSLYKFLELPIPKLPYEENKDCTPLLVYGGSTASGTLAIQFAKMSGLTVITTASPHNFELLQSLGADYTFDYHDPECGHNIRTLTNNKLRKVYDTIATESSARICSTALSSAPGGLYVNLMGCDFPRDDVRNEFPLGYTSFGETFEIEGQVYDAVPGDYKLAKSFIALCEDLLEEGKIRSHPADVRLGIEGIIEGMQELKEGNISGAKLVYRIGEE